MSWATFGQVTYDNGYVYPINIQILGYFITGCTVIWIPVMSYLLRETMGLFTIKPCI